MKGETLIIRADASTQMGTGHVMRCLALVQAWQAMDGQAIFVTASLPDSLIGRVEAENVQIERITAKAGSEVDANATISLARKLNATAIVIDGYQFDGAYQSAVKTAGFRTLFVDDYGHCDTYVSDWVLNQNVYASEALYPHRTEDVKLLLGTQYALLRREFWSWGEWKRPHPTNPIKLLVTLGGADPDNVTLTVIEAIKQISDPQLDVVVLVGGSNPHYEQLLTHADDRIILRQNVTDMPQLMAWADVAISAGGSTCWELALMGLPNLILILAENQRPIATALHKMGVAVNVGWGNEVSAGTIASHLSNLLHDRERWQSMSRLGRLLVDGFGAKRAAKWLKYRLHIRPVNQDDVELIFTWANDDVVRQSAYNSQPIQWSDHVDWFVQKTNDHNCIHFVGIDEDDQPVGQIRFDKDDNRAFVDISVASNHRGKGYATQLLRLGVSSVCRLHPALSIIAEVKRENEVSNRVFKTAGFRLLEHDVIHGHTVFRFLYEK